MLSKNYGIIYGKFLDLNRMLLSTTKPTTTIATTTIRSKEKGRNWKGFELTRKSLADWKGRFSNGLEGTKGGQMPLKKLNSSLIFLLFYYYLMAYCCCYCCFDYKRVNGMEYSANIMSCDDMENGFNDQKQPSTFHMQQQQMQQQIYQQQQQFQLIQQHQQQQQEQQQLQLQGKFHSSILPSFGSWGSLATSVIGIPSATTTRTTTESDSSHIGTSSASPFANFLQNSVAISDMNAPQTSAPSSEDSTTPVNPFNLSRGNSHYSNTRWKCCCWNSTNQDEVECRCEGEALTRVPQTLTVSMQRLTIASAGLPRLRNTGLRVYSATLLDVVLTDLKQLESIQDGAFASLRLLRTIYISHAPKLTYLSKDVFQGISDTIKSIRIINSGLTNVPDLIHLPPANILQMIDLDNNHITRIEKHSIHVKTEQLILANNDLEYIDDSAFHGSEIAKLSLKENRKLKEVHPNAFAGMSMQDLDLSSTSLVRLPSAGLQNIEILRIENTQTLKTIPSIYNFKNLQKAYLTHSFHCCAFKFPSRHDPKRHLERMKELEKWQEQCKKPKHHHGKSSHPSFQQASASIPSSSEAAPVFNGPEVEAIDESLQPPGFFHSRPSREELPVGSSSSEGSRKKELFVTSSSRSLEEQDQIEEENEAIIYDVLDDDVSLMEEIGVFHEKIEINPQSHWEEFCGNFTFSKHEVECYPMPNALNPCEDVMGYQWLRISVWIVVALAVVGNVAVLVVILSIKSESSSVPRFLMCHLAFADLCLGLYLLLIASIDAHSMGEYFNYAYDWQYGAGCKVAGFLTVFASHLSVFTLTIITLERWMAITHALYLNKRIKLKPAAFIMFAGWLFSIFMSSLPLFGISNYSSTSICLPMENRDLFDTSYLVLIMGLNGAAFCIIAVCYAQIYFSLRTETRHARGPSSGEMGVAKKMALLVFTNFACWAPIAFFGLTALAGYPLINVTKSKILLVFFYPLNSCADPYLYAILTSQYRTDLYTLMSKFRFCRKAALKYKNSLSTPNATTNFTINNSVHRHNSSISKSHPSIICETQLMLKNQEDFV